MLQALFYTCIVFAGPQRASLVHLRELSCITLINELSTTLEPLCNISKELL